MVSPLGRVTFFSWKARAGSAIALSSARASSPRGRSETPASPDGDIRAHDRPRARRRTGKLRRGPGRTHADRRLDVQDADGIVVFVRTRSGACVARITAHPGRAERQGGSDGVVLGSRARRWAG